MYYNQAKQIIDRLDTIIELLGNNNCDAHFESENNTEKRDLEHKHLLIQFDLVKSQITCLESQNEKILDKLEAKK